MAVTGALVGVACCAPTLVTASAARSPTTITIAVVFIFSPFAYREAGRSLERALNYAAVHNFHFTELVREQQ
jgi:ABC-type sulfate transport system permease component